MLKVQSRISNILCVHLCLLHASYTYNFQNLKAVDLGIYGPWYPSYSPGTVAASPLYLQAIVVNSLHPNFFIYYYHLINDVVSIT